MTQQCCNAVLRKQSSLRTVSYNITFTCCVRLHTPCCMLSRVLIVRSCCIRWHTTAKTDATTPNIVGSTLSKYIKTVVGTLHLSLRTVKRYERLVFKLWRTVCLKGLKKEGGLRNDDGISNDKGKPQYVYINKTTMLRVHQAFLILCRCCATTFNGGSESHLV